MVDKEMGEIHTSDNEIECYICTGNDPIPWKSDCNCTDRYVHSECQIELIDKTGSLKCPVCLVEYRNINPTYYRKFYINSKAVWVFIVFLLSLTVSVCATVLLIAHENRRNKNSALGFAGGVFVGFSGICFILIALFIKSEGGFKKLYIDCYVPHIKLEFNEPKLCA
tara:strand:- start:405 stop:905 length:501 start_codon:yes stop_codon:yes gene_type:complete